jgi:hypothetical protein
MAQDTVVKEGGRMEKEEREGAHGHWGHITIHRHIQREVLKHLAKPVAQY